MNDKSREYRDSIKITTQKNSTRYTNKENERIRDRKLQSQKLKRKKQIKKLKLKLAGLTVGSLALLGTIGGISKAYETFSDPNVTKIDQIDLTDENLDKLDISQSDIDSIIDLKKQIDSLQQEGDNASRESVEELYENVMEKYLSIEKSKLAEYLDCSTLDITFIAETGTFPEDCAIVKVDDKAIATSTEIKLDIDNIGSMQTTISNFDSHSNKVLLNDAEEKIESLESSILKELYMENSSMFGEHYVLSFRTLKESELSTQETEVIANNNDSEELDR